MAEQLIIAAVKLFIETVFSLQQDSEGFFFVFFLKVLCFLEQNGHHDQGDILSLLQKTNKQ